MKAIRTESSTVFVHSIKDNERLGEYNLHYHLHCDELMKKVGKQVYDLLSFTTGKWINVNTLEITE